MTLHFSFCKENGNAVEIVEERNWMFRLQKYKSQLLSFLRANPSWVPLFSSCDADDSVELPARRHTVNRRELGRT